jgi:ComF family protein
MVTPRLLLATSRDLPPSLIRRLTDGLFNLLYPELCLVCSAPAARSQDCGVCDRCWQKALQLRISEPFCPLCGVPYRSFEREPSHLCGRCTVCLPPYAGARAFGCYSAELSLMIQALKFYGRQDMAKLLAPLLASTFLEFWSPQEINFILPVPLHPKRRRERGYNQATLLGLALGRLLGLPCRERMLKRVRPTLPQVGLSESERNHNVADAFHCPKPAAIRGQRILLVDDVMTTGSTVASACEALQEAGALRISVLTVARAVTGWE